MGLIKTITGVAKRWYNMIFKREAQEIFQAKDITSEDMQKHIAKCVNIYRGKPPWLCDDIRTINFARSVCSETARLTVLAIGIHVSGSARADWINQQIESIYYKLRDWVEYGCAFGTVIPKPNGQTIDLFTPDRFFVTDEMNGNVVGAIFVDKEIVRDKYYTRFEYHRFLDDGAYMISNRCYISDSENDTGKYIEITNTPWPELMEDTPPIIGLDAPLFGVLKMPQANSIDIDSPLGIPVFSDAIEELRDLDVSYTRNANEIEDSKRTVLLDSDRLLPGSGNPVKYTVDGFCEARKRLQLPEYIKNVYGSGTDDFYQEINPSLNTDTRLSGINALLSQIGYKCGYSNGYFVFNETSGIATATQIEADQQRTIQLIKDVRDKLENCIDGLIYALNAFADLYNLAPVGTYEITYDFGDITYNRNEERTRWWSYVLQGKIPFWKYLVKFEGIPEEEAKELEREAQTREPDGFEEE